MGGVKKIGRSSTSTVQQDKYAATHKFKMRWKNWNVVHWSLIQREETLNSSPKNLREFQYSMIILNIDTEEHKIGVPT
jgi:hypothetical protein